MKFSFFFYCRKYRPNNKWIRPDFMKRKGQRQRVYLSKRILGQFYRHCCFLEKTIQIGDEFIIANEEFISEKRSSRLILNG